MSKNIAQSRLPKVGVKQTKMTHVANASNVAPKPFAAICFKRERPVFTTSFRVFIIAIRTFFVTDTVP
jgi:hypothetical protein